MNVIWENEGIKVQNVPACYLCGSGGCLLYGKLRDKLFGAPGEWHFKKCTNSTCGLVWLDPIPTEADIPKLYEVYYTHQANAALISSVSSARMGKRLTNEFRRARKRAYHLLLRLTTLHQARIDLAVMYLANHKPGTLLEVGCGNGAFLARMRSRGWQVQGVEPDPTAAKIAEEAFGVRIYVGTLEEANYPGGSFDALTLNHVIEHVRDPIALLRGCHRVLKPGGRLVMVTPNIDGIGHARFKQYWRGLEPPRHLHLFSRASLESIGHKAGFRKAKTWTTPANVEVMALGSTHIQLSGRNITGGIPSLSSELMSECLQLRALMQYRKNPNSGDEIVLKASK